MQEVIDSAHAPALVVAGMHRSGTSLTASLCQSGGLFIGQRIMPGYPGKNPAGHFEDLDFYEFHRDTLTANGRLGTGFEIHAVPPKVDEHRLLQAQALVAARRSLGVPWGWKDPRTVLFLDFWAEQLPEAKFLLVFRRPWEVVDSLFRRNDNWDAVFRSDLLLSSRLWCHYNKILRDFALVHPNRVLVREVHQIYTAPETVFADIRSHLGIPLADPQPLYQPHLLVTIEEAAKECVVALAEPECLPLYADLSALAGLAGSPDAAADVEGGPAAAAVRALAEWARLTDSVRPT